MLLVSSVLPSTYMFTIDHLDICSDKTGTLTTNQMTVLEGWISGAHFADTRTITISPPLTTLLGETIAVNSTAYPSTNIFISSILLIIS